MRCLSICGYLYGTPVRPGISRLGDLSGTPGKPEMARLGDLSGMPVRPKKLDSQGARCAPDVLQTQVKTATFSPAEHISEVPRCRLKNTYMYVFYATSVKTAVFALPSTFSSAERLFRAGTGPGGGPKKTPFFENRLSGLCKSPAATGPESPGWAEIPCLSVGLW